MQGSRVAVAVGGTVGGTEVDVGGCAVVVDVGGMVVLVLVLAWVAVGGADVADGGTGVLVRVAEGGTGLGVGVPCWSDIFATNASAPPP